MKSLLVATLKIWLPLAFGLTVLAGTVYAAVQQDLRQSADDPQIQLSEDGASALAAGKAPQAVVSAETVDISASLAPFLIVVDETGKVVASSARLGGETPLPPAGVFDAARERGQNRLTWQPRPGVRIAAIVTHYRGSGGSGFVLAGRSIREVEWREDKVSLIALAGWAGSLAASLVAAGAVALFTSGRLGRWADGA